MDEKPYPKPTGDRQLDEIAILIWRAEQNLGWHNMPAAGAFAALAAAKSNLLILDRLKDR